MTSPHSHDLDNDCSYSDNAEFWIKIIQDGLDPYRTQLTNDLVLKTIRPSLGLRVLDAGCGEGYMSRAIARQGAIAVGVDACDELIQAATTAAREENLPIEYFTANVDNLPLEDSSVDVVVCNHLVNDLQELKPAFQEFRRVLTPGGRLIILMLHPCFYRPHDDRTSSQPSVSAAPSQPSVSAAEYFTTRFISQPFKVAGIISPAKVRVWLRPLEEYTSSLTEADFFITALTEPHPSPQQFDANPWWALNFRRPLFMLIEAKLS
jgi:2-polyprenyl-3-methyl-5-hydroxy-6-metoxy-1,4-benzoquinol methylase